MNSIIDIKEPKSQYKKQLTSSPGATEASWPRGEGGDEAQAKLNVDVKDSTEEEEFPEHNQEASGPIRKDADVFQEFLKDFNVDDKSSTDGESTELDEGFYSDDESSTDGESAELDEVVAVPGGLADPFRPYINIPCFKKLTENELKFIVDTNPYKWDKLKIKNFIDQSNRAMKKKKVKKVIKTILEKDGFKQIAQKIIGTDWREKIDNKLIFTCFSHKNDLRRTQLEKIKKKKKRKKIMLKILHQIIAKDFITMIYLMRNTTHYSEQKCLKELGEQLGEIFPDNVVIYFEKCFPGYFVLLLVLFKTAYPSKEKLRKVLPINFD